MTQRERRLRQRSVDDLARERLSLRAGVRLLFSTPGNARPFAELI